MACHLEVQTGQWANDSSQEYITSPLHSQRSTLPQSISTLPDPAMMSTGKHTLTFSSNHIQLVMDKYREVTVPLGHPYITYCKKKTLTYGLTQPIGLFPNEYNTTRTGWVVLPTQDAQGHYSDELFGECRFGIAFTPGEGAIIHQDLYDRISSADKTKIRPLKLEAGWDGSGRYGNLYHRTPGWLTFGMPITDEYVPELEIIGETAISFGIRRAQPGEPFVVCKVKALVTTTPLPAELNGISGPEATPLAWIGVGMEERFFRDEEPLSLFRYDNSKQGYRNGKYVDVQTYGLRLNTPRKLAQMVV